MTMSANFRSPNGMMVNNSLNDLAQTFSKLTDLQDEAASLKKLRKPSDSPSDTVSAMQLNSSINRNTQYSTNLNDATAWLGAADSTLQSITTQLQRVNTLLVQAANGSADSTSQNAIASEIDSIRQGLIGLANTQQGNRPLFGGTASGAVAYDANGNYVGISSAVMRNVAPNQQVQVNINGDQVFGAPGSDLFTTLTNLSTAIRSGNTTQLSTLQTTFNSQTQNVETQLAAVGSREQRVQSLQTQNSSNDVTMKQNLSTLQDADVAQVMMQLQTQEVAYQAALQATAKAITPTLADFLQ
jgi:flagellar hook-associated protein 3 FlgL